MLLPFALSSWIWQAWSRSCCQQLRMLQGHPWRRGGHNNCGRHNAVYFSNCRSEEIIDDIGDSYLEQMTLATLEVLVYLAEQCRPHLTMHCALDHLYLVPSLSCNLPSLFLSASFTIYLIPLKKLASFILLLLAFLIAPFSSSRASWASIVSFGPIPAGRSMDCSSRGTFTT